LGQIKHWNGDVDMNRRLLAAVVLAIGPPLWASGALAAQITDSEGQKDAAEESTRRNGEGTLSSLASAIRSLAADYQSDQAQQRAHDRRVLWWTIAGAAAIFVYTLITLGIYLIRSHRLGCFRCSPGLR
jgi:hypothetical protein